MLHYYIDIYYRFDKDWLKEEFENIDQIDSNKGLSDKAKKYLKIIQGFKNLEAMKPSRRDAERSLW